MGTITVRQLDDETKQRLRIQAARNGHSMEQEARNILKTALAVGVEPEYQEPWVDRIRQRFAEIGYAEDLVIPPRDFQEVRVKFDE